MRTTRQQLTEPESDYGCASAVVVNHIGKEENSVLEEWICLQLQSLCGKEEER